MNRNKALLPLLLIFAFTAFSQTLPQGVRKITAVEGITEYALPNGLHVLLFPDSSKPNVTVNMTYMVGSRHEGYGETGMAHLLEHMLFLQTKTRKDVKQELKDHGAEMNGSTSWDRTNYFETLNATDENLKLALELEADRMVNSKIEKPLLDTEMTVVRNEFEMGENSPDRILMQRALETAYTWHNYGKLTIGNRSDIENVPINRLAAFYQKYYQPDNALLTIAGKFDEAKTLAMVANLFGPIPKPTRTLEKTYTVEPTQDGERSITLRRVGDTQGLVAIYHAPAGSHPDDPVLNVLSGVLGDSPSGRLYKALVDNKKAVGASMGVADLHDPGFIIVSAKLKMDQSLDEARQIMLKTVEGVVTEPPTKEEVERVKTRLLKNIELEMNDSQAVALDLSEYASQGDWRLMFLMRDRIKAVTPADVLRVAKDVSEGIQPHARHLHPHQEPRPRRNSGHTRYLRDVQGFQGLRRGRRRRGLRSQPLQHRIARRAQHPARRHENVPALTQDPRRHCGRTVTIRFGDEKSLVGKSAIAGITGGLLMRGTKNKSRQQIQDEMDRLKAQFNVSGGPTSASASIETIEANLPGALRLAAEILREPAFPDSEFETVRQQRIAAAEAGRSDPQALADHRVPAPHEPLSARRRALRLHLRREIEDLKKVTLDDVRKFYQQFYGASVGEIAVSGQFNAPEITKLATELFGNWKSPGAYTRITNMYRKVEPARQEDRNARQAERLLHRRRNDQDERRGSGLSGDRDGQLHVRRQRPGHAPLARIRDKEGLSYGVIVDVRRAHQGRWRQLLRRRHQQSAERPQGGSQLPR